MTTTKSATVQYRSRFRLIGLVLLVGLLSACGSDSSNGPILIKFPHVTAPGTPKGLAADRFKMLVEERMPGIVTVEVYPSGQLMNDDDSIDALAFGEVQMIAVSLSKLDRLTKKYQVFDLPFLFVDLAAAERFQSGPAREELLGAVLESGIRGVGFWHNGMKQFGGPVPITSPEAAEGLKFRIMESDVLQAQILQMGGNPQKMAFGEVYQALQTGAVDAQENTWANTYSSKFYEVQPYLTESNHGYLGYLLAVNEPFWQSLPEDVRQQLQVIIDEVSAWGNDQAKEVNAGALANIIESGRSEIARLNDDERKVWADTMLPVWDTFSDSIGEDLLNAALAAGQQ
jgi:C4-dicarboxylate-binding protein DctP